VGLTVEEVRDVNGEGRSIDEVRLKGWDGSRLNNTSEPCQSSIEIT